MAQSKANRSIENIIQSWESDKSDKTLSSIRASLRKADGAFDYKGFIPLVLEHVGHKFGETVNERDRKEKNSDLSAQFREKGNKIYKRTSEEDTISLKRVIELYTKSCAYACPDSDEIAYSYSNRSAVLYKLMKPREALEDVERGLHLNCPKGLKPKLLSRRGDCYAFLGGKTFMEVKYWAEKVAHKNQGKFTLEEFAKNNAPIMLAKILNEECDIPELKNPSAKYPIASDELDVKYSKNFGRHIVATRDIKFGEILVVEKTNFRFLSKENMYTHCAYCLASTITGVPCEHCVTSVYCSDKCKSEAWAKYHELECPVFDLLEKSETGAPCARLLMQMCSEAGSLEQLKKRVDDVRQRKDADKLGVKEDWYCNSSLESILYLTTNSDKVPDSSLEELTVSAMRTLFIILTHVNFYGIHYDRSKLSYKELALLMSQNPDVLFLGELLVELALIQKFNLYTAVEDNCDYKDPSKPQGLMSKVDIYMSKPLLPRGKVASPFVGLMNHSCFPNALMQHKRDHVVLYAAYPVKKGQQVFTSYGMTWCQMKLAERRQACSKYLFTCTCKACKEDWFTKYDMTDKKTMWDWKLGTSSPMLSPLFREAKSDIYGQQRDLRKKNEIMTEIQKAIETIHTLNCLPCMEIIMLYDLLMRIYEITGNTGKLQTHYALKNA